MSTGDFYRAFEDRHRGDASLVRARHEVYLPFVRAVHQLHPAGAVLDLGCGRGEWLALLRDEGVAAQGVDVDAGMLSVARELGLDVRQGDALAHLSTLDDGSLAMVTAFHVAEHLPFDALQALVAQAFRVLRPGGVLVLETPNPENLVTGSCNFYVDPTHQRPLPARLLEFLPVFHGFTRSATLRLHEHPKVTDGSPLALIDVLAGVSPDYAVVAQKPMPIGVADAVTAAFDAAFDATRGVTLNQLADRFDAQWTQALQEMRELAALARRQAEDNTRLQWELAHERAQFAEVLASRSFRLTSPLRWLSAQAIALREQGPRERLRRLAWTLPRLVGLGPRIDDWLARNRPPPLPVPDDLTPDARRVFMDMQQVQGREQGRYRSRGG